MPFEHFDMQYCSNEICAEYVGDDGLYCINCREEFDDTTFDPADLPIELFDCIIKLITNQDQIYELRTINKKWCSLLGLNVKKIVKSASDPRWNPKVNIRLIDDSEEEIYMYEIFNRDILFPKQRNPIICTSDHMTMSDILDYNSYQDAICSINIKDDIIDPQPLEILKNELAWKVRHYNKYFPFSAKKVEFMGGQDFVQMETIYIIMNLKNNGYDEMRRITPNRATEIKIKNMLKEFNNTMKTDVKFKILYNPVAKLEYIDQGVATFRLYNVMYEIRVDMEIVAV